MLFHALWFARVPASIAWLLLAVPLAAAALSALRAAHRYRSAAAVTVVLLAAAWSLSAAPDNGQLAGMNYHLLGINLAALMTGVPAALWFGALLLSPSLLISDAGRQAYPFNALALLLPPFAVNLSFRVLVDGLPANVFVFILLNGFTGSAAAMLLTGAVLTGVLNQTGIFPDGVTWGSTFPVFFLLSWAEAFTSGAATVVFVALKPHWINTFDDGRYLKSISKIWQFQTACHPTNGMFMLYDMTAVALGAVFGAFLRWPFGLMLVDTASWFASGTLAMNWFDGFPTGAAVELVGNPHWRLLLITGFLGSLTTPSGFSLEIVGMLQAQRWAVAVATASLYLFSSLLFTVLGIYPAQCFK